MPERKLRDPCDAACWLALNLWLRFIVFHGWWWCGVCSKHHPPWTRQSKGELVAADGRLTIVVCKKAVRG